MLVIGMIKWWYIDGWKNFVKDLFLKLRGIADRFSIGTLFRTLFSPFRQVDSGALEHGSIGDRLAALGGRLISRLVGAVTRIVIIVVGIIILLVALVVDCVLIVLWPLIPFLPIAGLALAVGGVMI